MSSNRTAPRARDLIRILPLVALVSACGGSEGGDSEATSTATVFEGARVIVGDGSAPIENAVFVVDGGRLTLVGASGDVAVPSGATRIDLTGKTVIPALVNAHMHLAPTRDAMVEQLRHLAYYGVGTAVSLGTDSGGETLAMRSEAIPQGASFLHAGSGITRPEPGRTEEPIWIDTPDEARAAVERLASQQVDIVKIWVDDRNGQYDKLTPELYGAVIDAAHQSDLKVTAHIFALDDAKGLLRAGVDAFAHSVRDRDVDDELIELATSRPDFVLVPNLPGPGLAADLSWLSGTVPAEQLEQMQARAVDNPRAQESFGIQARNLVRMSEAGVTIAFGTDGGSPWAAHQELEDMVTAGMSPHDVLVAATLNSAQLMGLDDVGAITAGRRADFVVLNGNPLDDITQTRNIASVYLRGIMVDRDRISARLLNTMLP